MDAECVESIVIDVCKKTILLHSDEGSSKTVECDTTEQFMNVVKVITDRANPEIITYADVAVK
mgnify:CR=1 FL=1|jgi:hypothetical protein|tara:strand:+ start:1436 stop:1624 length:189 start_codon:yes stop_codon:yes gene_type:complete